MNKHGIIKSNKTLFPTKWHSATMFDTNQVLILILLYHTWFRTGSAYTSNGIVDFLKEVKASLPDNIEKVISRADSGFFSGGLFDLLESFNWNYLVKVKLKNLEKLLQSQTWTSNGIKLYEHHFYKAEWEELDKLIETA